VGVTGPSGSGKTTFADLLVGLYPPQSGSILVGGTALEGGALSGWRDCIAYVAQDPFLFHDTIRQNLLWGNSGCSEADLWTALEAVGIGDFVRRANNGLDTVVGERGTLLSGGERQRISLARAILRRPRLLVLDEATNAIDVEAERAFLEKLVGQSPRPTIVIIAHRPESLRLCERLLVFENGQAMSVDTKDGIASRLSELSRREVEQESLATEDVV
jgi:ATP-binding cassette subfamily C protein